MYQIVPPNTSVIEPQILKLTIKIYLDYYDKCIWNMLFKIDWDQSLNHHRPNFKSLRLGVAQRIKLCTQRVPDLIQRNTQAVAGRRNPSTEPPAVPEHQQVCPVFKNKQSLKICLISLANVPDEELTVLIKVET